MVVRLPRWTRMASSSSVRIPISRSRSSLVNPVEVPPRRMANRAIRHRQNRLLRRKRELLLLSCYNDLNEERQASSSPLLGWSLRNSDYGRQVIGTVDNRSRRARTSWSQKASSLLDLPVDRTGAGSDTFGSRKEDLELRDSRHSLLEDTPKGCLRRRSTTAAQVKSPTRPSKHDVIAHPSDKEHQSVDILPKTCRRIETMKYA
jgi:hypothetical protein